MFPVKFGDKFERLGIKIGDPRYGAWWEAHDHLRRAHEYNMRWRNFLDAPGATLEQALAFARELAAEYGLTVRF